MSTIYTLNGKVLKNAATDKWLVKKEAPAGFVMDASNATYYSGIRNNVYVRWQSPSYPDAYNGNGKQYLLVNNNSELARIAHFMYAGTGDVYGGPDAISSTDMNILGTSTGTLLNNEAYPRYGMTFGLELSSMTIEQAQTYIANLTITILDA